ncbi:ras family-domain-containing protein [Anaeramoeba flamelloides]|uniref:Ras family-domain-containing protein n=1 Tax=Anaeramoeba flamelloides TaxID=1746091 RepID=A0AAV7ZXM3_9EUKA|nr:ras family-domain-containing protein [Anaeramoeba flamelloides]KAJ6233358.1 ras family-domain-containing protein [Anaeramoeba flamelloides]
MDFSTDSDLNEEKSIEHLIKVVVLGQTGCGKTSIILRFVENEFLPDISPTIGASFYLSRIKIDNKQISLRLWDTSGQEKFHSLVPLYYRNAQVCLLIYDITDPLSLKQLKYWMNELRNNLKVLPVLVVVANKIDMINKSEKEKIQIQKGEKYSKTINASFFTSSAKNGEGINEIFQSASKEVIRNKNKFIFSKIGEKKSIEITNENEENNKEKEIKKEKGKCC